MLNYVLKPSQPLADNFRCKLIQFISAYYLQVTRKFKYINNRQVGLVFPGQGNGPFQCCFPPVVSSGN